jgi:hypothetical protein
MLFPYFPSNSIFQTEESPPKKRKIDSTQVNKSSSGDEEKIEVDQPPTKPENDETSPTEPKDDQTPDATELKEHEKPSTSAAAAPNPALTSTIDLIKDIESHIEIIYECLDELNETVNAASSSQNKSSSGELLATSDVSSQESETKTVTEPPEADDDKNDHAAQNESKNEVNPN